jgi:hypothetical protein
LWATQPACQNVQHVRPALCRFRFEDDALEVVIGKEQDESENSFVGGQNRWSFDSFVNWEFWFPNFPILVYFKVSVLRRRPPPHTDLHMSLCCPQTAPAHVAATQMDALPSCMCNDARR